MQFLWAAMGGCRAVIAVGILLGGARSLSAATNGWAETLRQAVRLPQVAFNFEPNFGRNAGVTAEDEVVDAAAELVRLERALPGKLAEDAPIRLSQFRLAQLTGDTNSISRQRVALLDTYRLWSQRAPSNADALIGWGRALWLTGDEASAELPLRRAVELQPQRWDGWIALAEVLGSRSLAVFTGWGDHVPPNAMGEYFSGRLKPAGDALKARALLTEAVRCEERVVTLAPGEPSARAARLPFLLDLGMRQRVLADPQRPEARQDAVARRHQAEAAPEVEAVLKLKPDDHRLLGLSIYLRVLPELAEAGVGWNGAPDGRRAVDVLAPDTRKWLEARLAMLEKLSRPDAGAGLSGTNHSVAGAAEMVAVFRHSLFSDGRTARRWARQALELEPGRRVAFEVVTAALVQELNWVELESFSRQRLLVRDEPTVRLVLAKAQFNQGKKEAALKTLAEAGEKYPADRLLLAAWCSARLAVKATEGETEFGVRLARVFPDPANAVDETDANHSVLIAALISQALEGEQDTSKRVLRSMITRNLADDYARTILELLRISPTERKPIGAGAPQ